MGFIASSSVKLISPGGGYTFACLYPSSVGSTRVTCTLPSVSPYTNFTTFGLLVNNSYPTNPNFGPFSTIFNNAVTYGPQSNGTTPNTTAPAITGIQGSTAPPHQHSLLSVWRRLVA